MNFNLIVHFVLIFGLLETFKTVAIQIHHSTESCSSINNLRSKRSERQTYSAPNNGKYKKFNFANYSDKFSEKEIFLVKNLKKALEIPVNNEMDVYELEVETTALPVETSNKSLYSIFENTDNPGENTDNLGETTDNPGESTDNLGENTDNPGEVKTGIFEKLVVSENYFENTTSTVILTSSTEMTTKLNILTTQMTLPETHFLSKENSNKGNSICLCDLKAYECDINCCCDKDCSLSHFNTFTKCNDDHISHHVKYCYSNYAILKNNATYERVQKRTGLFCIARENLKVTSNYEKKPTITTLGAFKKILPEKLYSFSYKFPFELEATEENYSAGSPVWNIQNGTLVPFRIPHSTVGFLCNSEMNIKYLVDQTTECFFQFSSNKCGSKKIMDVLHYLKNTEVISSPGYINKMQKFNSSEVCKNKACIKITSFLCQLFDGTFKCLKLSQNATEFRQMDCWNVLTNIKYEILHNGSNGIIKVEAYLWVKRVPKTSSESFSHFVTDIKYTWVGTAKKVFHRSGNPGYLTGKPILAGRKIFHGNATVHEKEAIEVSLNPKDWLSVLGSKRGLCASEEKIPINFRENGQFTCFLKLGKSNFTKEKCPELQNNIFKLLLGRDVINATKESYFNKYVGIFGNSRVEKIEDWTQVLIDLFPLTSSQVSFKSNHYSLMCKNSITDLYIDIVYSNIGSVLAPQAKILGVYFHFGKHVDLTYDCDNSNCENTSLVRYFKLSSSVRFVDVTESPAHAFAEPLHLEARLPYDFFYPFFSKGFKSGIFSKSLFILILLPLYLM